MQNIDQYKQRIRACFNRAADSYDLNSAVQQTVGARLISLLDQQNGKFQQTLDLGCGTGRVTEALVKKINCPNIRGMDISKQLLQKAKNRLHPYAVQLVELDFDELSEQKYYDLIFSNMALQWSPSLGHTFNLIYKSLKDNSLFIFSLPLHNTFQELKHISVMNFYLPSHIQNFLIQVGFAEIIYTTEIIVQPFDSWLDALKNIKSIGANALLNPLKSLRGKEFLKNLLQTLQLQQPQSTLTYHIGYFIARKHQHAA